MFYSDPGSQLVSASGSLESWWASMQSQLVGLAASTNFSWNISPANSPWRQGKCEVRIKSIKKLVTAAVGSGLSLLLIFCLLKPLSLF